MKYRLQFWFHWGCGRELRLTAVGKSLAKQAGQVKVELQPQQEEKIVAFAELTGMWALECNQVQQSYNPILNSELLTYFGYHCLLFNVSRRALYVQWRFFIMAMSHSRFWRKWGSCHVHCRAPLNVKVCFLPMSCRHHFWKLEHAHCPQCYVCALQEECNKTLCILSCLEDQYYSVTLKVLPLS